MYESKHSPRFSIIIPTYNRAEILPRAIRSVLQQTWEDFELIIVDDASTDNTEANVADFIDKRVTYIRAHAATNSGAGAMRNLGIQQAAGEYICFLDDDDEYLPNFLASTSRVLEKAGDSIGLTWSGVVRVEDTDHGEVEVSRRVWQPQFADREQAYLSFLYSQHIGASHGTTIRRTCFDSIGLFDESMRRAQDTDLLIRMVRRFDFLVVPEILVKVHQRHGGPSTTLRALAAEAYERIIEKNAAALANKPDVARALYYKTGRLHYHAGNRRTARRFLARILHMHPIQPKIWSTIILYELLGMRAVTVHRRLSMFRRWMQQELGRFA